MVHMPPKKPNVPIQESTPAAVLVQKRETSAVTPNREKLCATCGRPFTLTPDQKFFLCARCYQKSLPLRKSVRKGNAQLLIQIRCVVCGAEEYISFVPADAQATYCKACYAQRKRKPIVG